MNVCRNFTFTASIHEIRYQCHHKYKHTYMDSTQLQARMQLCSMLKLLFISFLVSGATIVNCVWWLNGKNHVWCEPACAFMYEKTSVCMMWSAFMLIWKWKKNGQYYFICLTIYLLLWRLSVAILVVFVMGNVWKRRHNSVRWPRWLLLRNDTWQWMALVCIHTLVARREHSTGAPSTTDNLLICWWIYLWYV